MSATKVVELDVSSGTALGFRLKKNPKGTGFVIRSVDDDGLASASGKINAGDYIVDVNGEDVSKTTQIKDIGKHIKNATTILTLTFAMSAADVKAAKDAEVAAATAKREADAKAKADAEKAAAEAAAAAEAERIRLEQEAIAAKAAEEERLRLEAEAAEAARIAALPLSENRGAPTWRKKPTTKVSVGSLLEKFTEGVDVKAGWKSINEHGVTGKLEGRNENSGVMKLLKAHETAQKKSEEVLTADTVQWGIVKPVHATPDEDESHLSYEEVLKQRLERVKMAQQEKDEEARKQHLVDEAAAEVAAAAKAAQEAAKIKAAEEAKAAGKAHEEKMAKEAHAQRMREAELHRLKYASHDAHDWNATHAGQMQGGDFSDDDGFGFDDDFDC